MRSRDVVALVFGLLFTVIGAGGLWYAFVGALDWQLVQSAAPVVLVVVGALGLALSRRT